MDLNTTVPVNLSSHYYGEDTASTANLKQSQFRMLSIEVRNKTLHHSYCINPKLIPKVNGSHCWRINTEFCLPLPSLTVELYALLTFEAQSYVPFVALCPSKQTLATQNKSSHSGTLLMIDSLMIAVTGWGAVSISDSSWQMCSTRQ